jgi:membrane protein implicated in regulation of membrane protease activity
MMAELDIVFWHWWMLAVFLLAVEILAPGFFFLWLAVAGAVVGTVLWIIPSTSAEIQLLIFSILSIISVLVWRRHGFQTNIETDHPLLNERGAQYIGRSFSLIEPIENGRGKIKADDSIWTVAGDDCPLGTNVEVIEVDGTLFKVKVLS